MIPPADYGALRFWSDMLQYCLNGAIIIYLWFRDKRQASKRDLEKKFKDQDKRIADQEKQIMQLEEKIQRLPPCSHHDGLEDHMKELDKRLEDVQGKTNKICGRMEGFGSALDLIQQHLLSQAKGS